VELDQTVDRFGAAVAGASGVEVGQERFVSLLEGLPESLGLGDRAGRDAARTLLRDPPPLGGVLGLVDRAELLGALPGNVNLVVTFVSDDRRSSRARCRSVSFSAPHRRMVRIR
jgi:hypothetical protein